MILGMTGVIAGRLLAVRVIPIIRVVVILVSIMLVYII